MFYPTHMEKTYTISGVAGRTGVSIDTLRYYERIGLIHGVGRLSNTHRRYTESDSEPHVLLLMGDVWLLSREQEKPDIPRISRSVAGFTPPGMSLVACVERETAIR